MNFGFNIFLCLFIATLFFPPRFIAGNPIPKAELSSIKSRYTAQEKGASIRLMENPNNVSAYSARGDARLFLGNFRGARNDYEKMIKLNPKLEVSHWRLGIAYFYLEEYDRAAHQFKIYHNYDQVDRENGIWRFMSQYKSDGMEVAREGLLKYKKDDRPPYPSLYSMFAGTLTPEEVFERIDEEDFSERYRVRVLFHAYLYAGIYLELTEEASDKSLSYLRKAAANGYGRATGTYMWQVARLHHQLSERQAQGSNPRKLREDRVSPRK
jgi:lipoprotein NlpI